MSARSSSRVARLSTRRERLQMKDLGEGSFGVCKLATDLSDGEKVAVKFIARGPRVRRKLRSSAGRLSSARKAGQRCPLPAPRALLTARRARADRQERGARGADTLAVEPPQRHRLQEGVPRAPDTATATGVPPLLAPHPRRSRRPQVFLTDDKLGLCLEYANGGELFERVKAAGRFEEDMARFFFQQLLAGVQHCHDNGVAHRDLKLENTLLKLEESEAGRSPTPVLKIADFGFCKHEGLHTPPKSRVGTPAYISPVRAPVATPLPQHTLDCGARATACVQHCTSSGGDVCCAWHIIRARTSRART